MNGLTQMSRDRLILAATGALGGLAAYLLIEWLPDVVTNERVLLFVISATGAFFAALLGAAGPLRLPRAALASALLALPAAVLLTWASLRFGDVEDYLETAHPLLAWGVLVSVPLPFLIAALRPDSHWRDYDRLFVEAWNIVVRYAVAWLFTGLFWAVVFLSDALLGLVGLTIIERLLEIDPVPYVLTGAVLGLGLAVVIELADYVSPFLILRLLRLLLPVVLPVTVLFLVALPVQGLSDLFGGLSSAAVLMAMAFGIATLITSAVDRRDDEAAEAPVMRWSSRALALALPLLAGLAIYAIWLRVDEYGWTPDRLAAGTAAAVLMGYAVLYALVVLRGRGWMARIRASNTVMALVTVAVAALWLTPVMNPQRITAASQMARFERGAVDVEGLDLWFVTRELGRAGERVEERLAALDHPERAALDARLARLREAGNRYEFRRETTEIGAEALRDELAAVLPVYPEGVADPFLAEVNARRLRSWRDACGRQSPGGNPGCALILGELDARTPGREAVIFYLTGNDSVNTEALSAGAEPRRRSLVFLDGGGTIFAPETLDLIHAGTFEIAPVEVPALLIDGVTLIQTP